MRTTRSVGYTGLFFTGSISEQACSASFREEFFSETEKGSGPSDPNPFSLLPTPRQRVSTLRLEGMLVSYNDRLCEIPLEGILIKLSAVGRLVRVLRLHNGNPFNFPCA